MIYEEREIRVVRHKLPEFIDLTQGRHRSMLDDAGSSILCLLSTIVGGPPEDALLITSYPDIQTWKKVQGALCEQREPWEERARLVESETVRLLEPSSERPKREISVSDRRSVYGVRRFIIRPTDWQRFVELSASLWKAWEPALDSVILGLFRTCAWTDPQNLVLFTGYQSVSHWEETRKFLRSDRSAGYTAESWSELQEAHRIRNMDLPLSAGVKLMQANWRN